MKKLPFKKSSQVSIGTELELQIVDPQRFSLISRAKDLIRNIQQSPYQQRIAPEITQSMLEINSSVHRSAEGMLVELREMQQFLLDQAETLLVAICGGGTHPFQKWANQKIFPIKRYQNIARTYKYLCKRATVFGQHVQIGCTNAEDALYLTHALARYVPQLLALSAASPFYQGIDTGFSSSRSTVFSAFPLSGVIPYLTNWQEFSVYFYKMRHWGIIRTMKDFYWDIRPKPEFGTVEIRVCDTPLTLRKAVIVAAYLQSLALYLLEEKPIMLNHDLYFLYNYNRFQASRYGFEGSFINPYTSQSCSIAEDILNTVNEIKNYTQQLGNTEFIEDLVRNVGNKRNDAIELKERFKHGDSLQQVVAFQCKKWVDFGRQ